MDLNHKLVYLKNRKQLTFVLLSWNLGHVRSHILPTFTFHRKGGMYCFISVIDIVFLFFCNCSFLVSTGTPLWSSSVTVENIARLNTATSAISSATAAISAATAAISAAQQPAHSATTALRSKFKPSSAAIQAALRCYHIPPISPPQYSCRRPRTVRPFWTPKSCEWGKLIEQSRGSASVFCFSTNTLLEVITW